ncbi:nuclear transcription factor Y subunit A-10-like isoform X2 [Cornus florida]|uniref:nuclear transcription factor Y subunit A-10-like isoform X2 n=1 Tax=Cornus florida TaxID=4283 RepID=UPI00289E1308|nr:nuclear transcription factor Y subunit A-10-like isoform X2 [Cornus florida]
MTMHTVYFKEHEGIVPNPFGPLSSVPVPWWSGLGSPSAHGESYGQLKSSSMAASGDQLTATKQAERGTEQAVEKATQFTFLSGDSKSSLNRQKPLQLQAAISVQSSPPEYRGHFELGFSQPVICATYPYGDQCYGVFSTFGPMGRIMLTTDDGPIYVNAKQYHGIIRRRQSRAKAELDNKVLKSRKPYLHLSRHLHAMRRPRGCGGRFLNTKTLNSGKDGTDTKKMGDGQLSQSTGSQNSEVLQTDRGNMNSPKEANGSRSNLSGSEVTSMYSRGDFGQFRISHLQPSVYSLCDMMNAGHGIAMASKWVAAADSCCNLKV